MTTKFEMEKRPHKKRNGTIPPPVVVAPAPEPTETRVRFLKHIRGSRRGSFIVGQVAMLPVAVAKDWASMGIVEEDKSLDGPKETK